MEPERRSKGSLLPKVVIKFGHSTNVPERCDKKVDKRFKPQAESLGELPAKPEASLF